MRRLLTVLLVAAVTSGASLWWLYDGDLGEVHPALADIDAAEVTAWLSPEPDHVSEPPDRSAESR